MHYCLSQSPRRAKNDINAGCHRKGTIRILANYSHNMPRKGQSHSYAPCIGISSRVFAFQTVIYGVYVYGSGQP